MGTIGEAGFNTSTGRPTADVDIKINVPTRYPVGITLRCCIYCSTPTGHPTAIAI